MNADRRTRSTATRPARDSLKVEPVAALRDNYIWVIHDGRSAVVVDPGEAPPVHQFLADRGLELRALLLTHHHHDHIGGVDALLADGSVPVYGPADSRIPQVTDVCREGDRVRLDAPRVELDVLETPGHTSSHIVFHDAERLFCGDTLFSVGCGRLFEGDPPQMRRSLAKLDALPDHTLVYCAHEYTESNCRFALQVEPTNDALRSYASEVSGVRDRDEPSVPSTLGRERRCNPFLRVERPDVIAAARDRDPDGPSHPDAVFATLRRWKDEF